MGIQYISAVIFVKDIPRSRHFYEGILQQKVATDHGPNVGYESGFAIWQAEHAYPILYGSPCTESSPLGRQNLELYFETEDIDAVLAHVTAAGVLLVHPIVEQPWGQRVFRVSDPDGHTVEIAEPMDAPITRLFAQGMSAEEVAQKTGMPQEIVKNVLRAVGKE